MADRPLSRRKKIAEPTDYTDPTADAAKRSEAEMREDRLREIEAAILSTPAGREWVWGVLNGMFVFEERLSVTGSDHEAAFWAGQREAGLRLLRRFARGSAADFARMFHENDL